MITKTGESKFENIGNRIGNYFILKINISARGKGVAKGVVG